MATLGERLVEWLAACGVETVFGIPGVHTVEMYRGLAASPIHHVTPRHEQGAGFMADGYARVSGRPGVAFVITGPGLTNIATAMAQAYADSLPMLVVSAVNAPAACWGRTTRWQSRPAPRCRRSATSSPRPMWCWRLAPRLAASTTTPTIAARSRSPAG